MWNIIDADGEYFNPQNRTNNALESYNRVMNDKFPTPHPSLPLFMQTIEIKSRYQEQRLQDIRVGRVVPRVYDKATIKAVPPCYTTFRN